MQQLSLFEAVASPVTDKVLGELPREWTWMGDLIPSPWRISAPTWPDWEAQRALEARRIRRIHAAVRAGLLEAGVEYRPHGRENVIVPDGEPVPKWIQKYPATKGMGSCYVVRIRRMA
jgi:hypothetical protein